MNVRPAEPSDADGVESVFERSLRASYALSPAVIDELAGAYAGDSLRGRLREDGLHLVAEADGAVVGYAEGAVTSAGGTVRWLHVVPAARGRGIGTALFERTRAALTDRGADRVRAVVLADNQEGEAFLERFGLEPGAESAVERAGVEFRASVYAPDADRDGGPGVAATDVPDTVTVDGHRLAVDEGSPIPGADAPFLRTRRDDGSHHGFLCGNCGSTETAMDELERIECGTCGNVHRPDDWDGAYL